MTALKVIVFRGLANLAADEEACTRLANLEGSRRMDSRIADDSLSFRDVGRDDPPTRSSQRLIRGQMARGGAAGTTPEATATELHARAAYPQTQRRDRPARDPCRGSWRHST
jgi:hypothetical protein